MSLRASRRGRLDTVVARLFVSMVGGSFFSISLVETTKNTISLKDFERDLSALEREVFPKALNQTANDVGAKAKTAAMKALAEDMGILKKHLTKKRYFTISKSTMRTKSFAYTWSGSSSPFPLSYFKGAPLQHKSKLGKKGYAATTFGKRRQYKFFQAKMDSGHVGAFYRKKGARHGTSKTGGVGAYPIKQAYGPSIPVGMVREVVGRAWVKLTDSDTVEKKLASNIKFYMSKLKKGGR